MIQAKPAKLLSGEWGVKVDGPWKPDIGDDVEVTTASGKSWISTIAAKQGNLYAVQKSGSKPKATPRQRTRSTGCRCGSREYADGSPVVRNSDCWQCAHDY